MKASEMRVLNLSGTPFEQGRAYGKGAADLFRIGIDIWKRDIRSSGLEVSGYVRWLATQSEMAAAVARIDPDYFRFIEGMVDGSRCDFDEVMGFCLLDEDFWSRSFFEGRGRSANPQAGGEKCTTVAGRLQNGGSICAQNQDVEYEGAQVLLHFMPDTGIERYVYGIAGMTGLCGMNANGVSICVNLIKQLNHNRQGHSVAGLIFGALMKPDLPSATDLLLKTPHASGQAYTLADKSGSVGLEGSGAGARSYPRSARGHLVHTNHPLVAVDLRASGAGLSEAERAMTTVSENTQTRFRQARDMADQHEALDVGLVSTILSDRCNGVNAISSEGGGSDHMIGYTLGSMICVAPEAGEVEFHLASGPPSLEPYIRYDFVS